MIPERRYLRICLWSALLLALLVAGVAALSGGAVPAYLANKDFANYWIASQLVLSGAAADLFSDQPTYFAHMQAAFGPDYPWHAWSYPPHYLLFVWPLALTGYTASLAAFIAITLTFYLLAARIFVGRLDRTVLVPVLPFAVFNIWAGQNGFLTAALMLGSLALRSERPILAGLLAGCLTIKPQLGILLPVLFLIEGRWTVIASAAITTTGLAALSAVLFGTASWVGYVENTFVYQSRVMDHATGIFLTMMPSVFGSLRALGVDGGVALAAHAVLALPVLLAVFLGLLWCDDRNLRASILVVATFAVTPYSLAYDLGAFSAVIAFAAVSIRPAGVATGVLAAAALLPLVMVPFGLASLPIAPLVVLAVLVLLLHRAGVLERLSRAVLVGLL